MKSLVTLHLAVLHDAGQLCDVDTTSDRKTILSRVETEGDGFLSITLPIFAKALEKALAEEKWTHHGNFK